MRGKLVSPEARTLYWLCMINFLIGGIAIAMYTSSHDWIDLAVGLFCIFVGIGGLVTHWYINHPKMPEWAEDAFQGTPEIHRLGE